MHYDLQRRTIFLDYEIVTSFIFLLFPMTQQVDFFQKKLSNARSFKRQSKSSYGRVWVIVALILLALG
jgi:hypothetical protein